MATLIIKGGRVIDPASGLDKKTDLTIENGRVVKIARTSKPTGTILNASGCIVSPGLIDPHVHLREPGNEDKETIASGAAAGVNGGFTSICCMPNTTPTIDDDSMIEFIYQQAARAKLCNVYPVGAITKGRKGDELAEIGLMAQAEAVAFSDDGSSIASPNQMAKALRYIKMTNRVLMQHCEEASLTNSAPMNGGPLATKLGLAGWPAVAEEIIIQRDIMLNEAVQCRYHVQHLTTKRGVDIIKQARKAGQPVTAEVTPHHLLLTEDACATYDSNTKMSPPLRRKSDTKALINAIKNRVITILATDHAPHTPEEKELEFAQAPFGIISLDCALALYAKALIDSNAIDWPHLLELMTINPANLCNLKNKGRLTPKADADITIIDPSANWTIDTADFASKSRNCPYQNWAVSARPIVTIVAGSIKMNRDHDRLKK